MEITICLGCGKPATWIRHTQFAGSHPYCLVCAQKEDDFLEEDSYEYWEDLIKTWNSLSDRVKIGGTYRHKKGNLYRVDAVGKHTESLEPMVVYTALYENPDGKIWIRPLGMFLTPGRFTLVDD